MTTYVYQMILTEDPDGGYDVSFPDLPGCFSYGEDREEAVRMGIDAARTWVAAVARCGGRAPDATFGDAPEGSLPVVVAFETSPDYVVEGDFMSAAEASRRLGVTPGRVTRMIDSGILEGWRDGRHTWVTEASVNARLADERKAGRPRKAPVTA